jgi:uncharacterized protein involved in exopolysaccharide biosynthesis
MENSDEIRLKDVILRLIYFKEYLLRKKLIIMTFILLFGFLGVFYAMMKTLTYKAELTFVVDESQESGGLSAVSGIASQFGFNIGSSSSGTFSQSNIEELLVSKRVVQEALLVSRTIDDKHDLLIHHYIDFNDYSESWTKEENDRFKFPNNRELFSFENDSLMKVIYSDLINNCISTSIEEESSIVKISCVSVNESFAELLAKALVQKLEEYYTIFQTAKSENTLNLLSFRADSVLNELKNAEYQYASYKDANFGVQRAKGLLQEIRLKRDVEILSIMYGEIVKNLEISKFTLINNKPLLNIIDEPNLPLEDNKLSSIIAFVLFSFLGGFLICFYLIFSLIIKEQLA